MAICKAISYKSEVKPPSTMKNVSHKESWNRGSVQIHVNPLPIPLIKSNNDTKFDNDCVKKNPVGITC